MRTNLITGICVAFIAFLFVAAMPQFLEAGPVVPKTGGSSQGKQAAGLPGLPNYAESADDEETHKRMGRQRQPASGAPRSRSRSQYGFGAGGYGPPQMPLPPTYTPGAPASYGQPASAARLPMSPTAYGTYDSFPGFGQPGMGPDYGQMSPGQTAAGQQGGFGLPPSPTAQSPTAVSPAAAGPHQAYGPYSPTDVRQQTTPQRSVASHRQQSTVPAGSKPFQSYTSQPVYSPYMSLFRTEDAARGVNNYYDLVKPALDQRQKNQQVGREIRGLQRSSQYQGQNLQQLNQRNQARQRPGNIIPGSNAPQRMPATFMNTQQFYPGLR